MRPGSKTEDRVDRRDTENRTGKRMVIQVLRERGGGELSLCVGWLASPRRVGCGCFGPAAGLEATDQHPDTVLYDKTAWGVQEVWFLDGIP